jgi:hypothetical protein
MGWSKKRGQNLAADLDILLDDLCTQWGFCNNLSGEELTAGGKELTARAFADAVLLAEDMFPEYEIEWHRRLRDKFVERYDSRVSQKSYPLRTD